MHSILNKINSLTKANKLVLAALAFLAVMTFGGGRAHAATLNVTGGCTLNIAIASVNAGANQSGCTAVVSPNGYGTNDTITIPAGTITLSADTPTITQSVSIEGAGMAQTTVSGNAGQYRPFNINNSSATVTVQDLKIVSYLGQGILSLNGNVILSDIEVDGSNALPTSNQLKGVELGNQAAANVTASVNNLYVHDLDASATQGVYAFSISTTTANIQNTTVYNINNSSGDAGAFFMIATSGTINATAINTTIDKVSASAAALGFGALGAALSGDVTIHVIVKNVTVAELDGSTGSIGQPSMALFSGGAAAATRTVTIDVDAENSLLTNNKSDNVSSNCGVINGNVAFGGLTGTVNVAVNSDGHNLSDDSTCTSFTEDGDQQNVANLFSTLGPLQDNGGPVPTMALLPGSPALTAGGSVLGITTDARGISRPGTCPSVGAFQFEGAVCGASTPSASGDNAGAPNTGIGSVSSLFAISASLLGLSMIAYASRKRLTIK